MRSSRPAELFVHPAEDWERERGMHDDEADRLRRGQAALCILAGCLVSWSTLAVIAWIIL